MREMKDSGVPWIGEIPKDWTIRQANQVFTESKRLNDGLVEKNLLSLSYGKIVRKNIDTSFGLLPESFEGYNIIDKDMIVLRLTDLQNDQRSLRVGLANERGIITSAYLSLRCKSNDEPKYLWEGIKNLRFYIPSSFEQRRIADFLDVKCSEIDSILEQTKASIVEYKALKQSVITEAVTKGIRGDRPMKDCGVEWIGEIPVVWGVSRHKYVMHKEKDICESYSGQDIISLTMNGVIVRDLDAGGKMPTSFDGYQFVEPGTLLLCLFDIDVTPRCVGLVKNHGVTSPAYSKFIVHEGYHAAYYDYLLRYIDDNKFFVHLAKNLRSSLTESDFGVLPTIVPPIDEQQEIAAYLDEKCSTIDSLIASKEALISELEAYKKSLIYEYVTGKKRVKEA